MGKGYLEYLDQIRDRLRTRQYAHNVTQRNKNRKLLEGKIIKYTMKNRHKATGKMAERIREHEDLYDELIAKEFDEPHRDKWQNAKMLRRVFKRIQARQLVNKIREQARSEGLLTEDLQDIISKKKDDLKACQESCKLLSKELRQLQSDHFAETVKGIGFDKNATLIDLLVHRILDPSPEWKSNIEFLIDIPNDLTNIPLKGGSYFEALFHLLFAINYYPAFKDKRLEFMSIYKYKELSPFKGTYLYDQNILSAGGNADIQGISDITFKIANMHTHEQQTYKCGTRFTIPENNDTEEHYFFSIKGFRKEKSVKDSYDIPLLFHQTEDLKIKDLLKTIKRANVCVGVRDKGDFIKHLNRTKATFINESLSVIIGFQELMNHFETFRIDFFNRFGRVEDIKTRRTCIESLYPRNVVVKPVLSLFYHQELIASLVIRSIFERRSNPRYNDKPHFLCVGVLPRGGKSYIAGDIIRRYRESKQSGTNFNVLFLTSAVTETLSQFKTDLIEKFSDFHDMTFVDARRDKIGTNNFVFMSRQLSSAKMENDKKDASEIVSDMFSVLAKKNINLEYDMVFYDEAHIGILTKLQQNNLKKAFSNFKTPIILMSATYIKPANLLDNHRDLFVWDLFDINDMRRLPMNGLEDFKTTNTYDIYGEPAIELLHKRMAAGETLESIAQPYVKFPSPSFISPTFSEETQRKLKRFNYNNFFMMKLTDENQKMLKDSKQWRNWHNCLAFRDQAQMLRNYLTPKDTEVANKSDLIAENDKAFVQIFKKAFKENTRPIIGNPFSVLMFLPIIDDNPVGELCRVWGSFLMNTQFWSENFIALSLSPIHKVSSKDKKAYKEKAEEADEERKEVTCWKNGFCTREEIKGGDLKTKILELEREALKENKGLLMLSGEVAKMGISLPCTDVVCLLSTNDDSADDLIQKMFRSLTDSDGKKFGYVIDLNIKRLIRAMFEYDLAKDKIRLSKQIKTKDKRLEDIFEMCDWGYDSFIEAKKESLNYEEIMSEIKQRVFSNLELFNVTSKIIQDDLFDTLMSNDTVKQSFIELYRNKPTGKKKAVKLGEMGQHLPGPGDKPSRDKEDSADTEDKSTDKDAKKEADAAAKAVYAFEINFKSSIMTFLNSLIARNSRIGWDKQVSLTDLLYMFEEDRKTATYPITCGCSKGTSACESHSNMFERIYCDLKSYTADEQVPKLIDGIYNFITNHPEHYPNLQVYLDTFVDEMLTLPKKVNKTRKKRRNTY